MQRLGSGGETADLRIRVAGLLLLTAHLLFVGWLTLRPLSVPWVAPANLHPLATIRSDLDVGGRTALEGIGGGLLLLAPLGALLPLVLGRLDRPLPGTVARTVFAGAMLSIGIALAQTGVPGRVVDIDAVLLNTVGVAAAHLLLFPPLRRWLRGRDRTPPAPPRARTRVPLREEGTQGSTPRATRVGIAP